MNTKKLFLFLLPDGMVKKDKKEIYIFSAKTGFSGEDLIEDILDIISL